MFKRELLNIYYQLILLNKLKKHSIRNTLIMPIADMKTPVTSVPNR